jgi:hypothetical protein
MEPVRSRCAQHARPHIDRLFARPHEPAWIGTFTSDDRKELSALRAAQAVAIEREMRKPMGGSAPTTSAS